MKHTILTSLIISCLLGCGVKGDPQPPLEPNQIGRGREDYAKKRKTWEEQQQQAQLEEQKQIQEEENEQK